jgi:hypothetical protein
MFGAMRRVIRPPFKHWWPVGGLVVCGLIVAGWWTGWSGGFLATTAIVAGIYVGLPPMEYARREMLGGGSASRSPVKGGINVKSHVSGGAMVWDTQINPVVHALASVINDPYIIRDIAMKSGLSMRYVIE